MCFQAVKWLKKHPLATVTPTGSLPSLTTAVTGENVRGSWWSHPKAHDIYAACQALDRSPFVLTTKLVNPKVTFIHRRIWGELLRVTLDREWERATTVGLDPATRRMLRKVKTLGCVRWNDLTERSRTDRKVLLQRRQAVIERGLVITSQMHTESGRHTALLQSWQNFSEETASRPHTTLALSEALERMRTWAKGCALTIDAFSRGGEAE